MKVSPKIPQVIKELTRDLNSIYNTHYYDNFTIIHYSLKYPEFEKILKRYSMNLNKFHTLMMETIKANIKVQEKLESQYSSVYSERHGYFDDDGFTMGEKPKKIKPDRVNLDKVFNSSIPLEIRNMSADPSSLQSLQVVPDRHGQNAFEMTPSLLTFFEAFIRLAQQDKELSDLITILDESEFRTNDFLRECDSGEVLREDPVESLCQNLNNLALENKISKVIGREKEIESVILTLTKHKKNNPVLIGKAGVGKTAIAEGLAEMIVKGNVPKKLKNSVVYNLEVANLVAGTKYRGAFEEKIMNLLKEFKKKEEKGEMPILFIDEIHSIVGSGNTNGLDLANILKPALARGEIRTIGATTTDEWYQFITDNKALKRRFIPITIKEPTYSQTFTILKDSKESYEKKHGVKYEINSIIRAIELSNEFIEDSAQPDKSFDLIDIAGSYCSYNDKKVVKEEDIETALHKIKNISLDAIQYSKKKDIIPIEDRLAQKVFGQEDAIKKVSKAVNLNLSGIGDPSKPIASFLLVGKTGTGKTELAKALANEMNAHLERLDMSEYMDEMSANKLLGSAPGFVGYDSGSPLTKAIQENPRTVLLLDEIEKANPKIFNLLLQAMDNAQITDSKGNKISFKNVVLIMTSNAGAKELETKSISLSGDNSASKTKSDNEIKKYFAPEFRGRLDGIIHFNPMSEELMEKILNKEIKLLNERLSKKKITLKISKKLKDSIISDSLKKNLGARPIKGYLKENILSLISNELLYGDLKDIESHIDVTADLKKDKVILKK